MTIAYTAMHRLLLPLILCCSATQAAASTIYRYVDRDGHVTFTNMPQPGAQAITITPANPDTQGSITPRSPPRSRAASPAAANVNVPSVDAGTQRNRDEGRRRILQTELENEQKALGEAKAALNEAKRKPGTNTAQLQRLQDAVTDRERNIEALSKELGHSAAPK
jgi:hypothetical protein